MSKLKNAPGIIKIVVRTPAIVVYFIAKALAWLLLPAETYQKFDTSMETFLNEKL